MPRDPTAVPRQPPKVLIVEDEPRLRELLLDVVPDMGTGFSASAARSAEEATRVMEADPHDVLVLDLHLPGAGGMDFFEQTRRRWPNVQVIVITGFGDLESARRAIRLDVVDFLGKPCRLGELEVALTRAARRLARRDAPSPATDSPPPAPPQSPPTTLEDLERQQILAALDRNDGNRTVTAAQLGISRRTLQYRLSQYARQGFLVD